MRRIEEYKRLEDDRQQSKGKAPATSQYAKDSWTGVFQPRPRRELRIQELNVRPWEINVVLKEPVHKILELIKNESYFWWPSKTRGDLARRNQSLYCMYHRENGHTTEQCRVFKDHLEQLVKSRHLKEFVVVLEGSAARQTSRTQGSTLPPLLGVIEVIHMASMSTNLSQRKGVLSVVSVENSKGDAQPRKKSRLNWGTIEFRDKDLEGTT
ncbi:uncharacterized protein LOC112000272 [Quercus suber]|uniref:uncharacterized protein LOC112000272 n=1 Tax=Quercus suber TaxID=58331 RepID=UPI000CE21ECD|nr:uncharacterized protein LOC112000272 [Quercus suber]